MKKIFTIFLLTTVALSFYNCKKDKDPDDGYSNRLKVGNKYACPLDLLSTATYDTMYCINLDGGDSYVDEKTKKWYGHGPRIIFKFYGGKPDVSHKIPIGIFTVKKELSDVQYSEDFNNEGPNYNPVLPIDSGLLITSISESGLYELNFSGVDSNDSLVVVEYEGIVDYEFDYRN